ncbi:MAG: hypothetical protein ACM336_03145 [Acidobacteriota bacterium]
MRFVRCAALVCAAVQGALAAGVVFVRPSEQSAGTRQVEIAAGFYGLDLGAAPPLAVVIDAGALAGTSRKSVAAKFGNVPVLIAGITPETDRAALAEWSGGAVTGCERMTGPGARVYAIAGASELAGPLSGLKLPVDEAAYLTGAGFTQIASLRAGERQFPVFVETTAGKTRVFLAAAIESHAAATDSMAARLVRSFPEVASAMMFFRSVAGERAWHSAGRYANLTIDDPWLREPYGNVSYQGLLAEMESHNFHTTIAFIPWNYDRSQAGVVALFRNHPDRFSISVHGDNHDHKEFRDYKTKPLGEQAVLAKQALARMNEFRSRTGIAYDPVMVFPHSIAPAGTLGALKRANFLATVNSSNVPMERTDPPTLPFALRPVTLEYADFPSIVRQPPSVGLDAGFVEINQFLGNPLLFYCHQDLFETGPDAFNAVADRVNRLEPKTRWAGLGEIARHSYLLRERDDADYDVTAFTGELCLDNTSGRDAVFHVSKQDDNQPAVESVSVDGRAQPFRFREGRIEFSLRVPAAAARTIVIRRAGAGIAAVSPDKNSAYVYFLRMASDFRDMYLARNAMGRGLIRLNVGRVASPAGALIVVLAIVSAGVIFYARRMRGPKWSSTE